MNKNIYCEECDVEYRVRCDADDQYYDPVFCPFCGTKRTNEEEQYECEDEEE